MLQQTNGPAGKGGAGVQLSGANSGLHSKNPAIPQATRTVLKAENGHLIGSPRVVIDRALDSATVWLANAPWGWGTQEITFLNPKPGGAAERHAAKLHERIVIAAARELERRNRIKAARAEGGGR